MGQYYKIIILSDIKHTPEIIRVWICPSTVKYKISKNSYTSRYYMGGRLC